MPRVVWSSAGRALALVAGCAAVACGTPSPTRDGDVDSSDARAVTEDANARADAAALDAATLDSGEPLDARSDTGARADVVSADRAIDSGTRPDASTPPVTVTNPVLGEDHADPHVVRTTDSAGRLVYYLYATSGFGDFVPWESRDLVRWTRRAEGLFRRSTTAPNSIEINGAHYCHLWAPDVVEVRPGVWMLSFSAVRHRTAQRPCPPYREDGGVYFASAASATGPFATTDHPWEPLVAGGHITDCAAGTRNAIPRSVPYAAQDCQGGFCHQIVRLDSAAFRDSLTGRWWLGYSWYTNVPPAVPWERTNYGQHASLVELDGADPFTVRCSNTVPQIHVGNPHDASTLGRLRASCPRCGEMLSFTRARDNNEFVREGYTFGVNEGIFLFRRGRYVYALLSGSVWDSGYYNVWYAAAETPEQLAWDSPTRFVGRFLVPNRGQSFGHGTAVQGPDGARWYYVHHRLQADRCRTTGNCRRDVWLSPMDFEDRGDGRGAAWIRTRFPAEDPSVTVALP